MPSLHDFNIVWGRYTFRKLDCWTEESPITDLSKGKRVFSPLNFLISFKDLFGVKISVYLRLEKLYYAWGLEKRKEKKEKEERSTFHQERQVIASGICWGWYRLRYVMYFVLVQFSHRLNFLIQQFGVDWMMKSQVLEEHYWILIGWVVACLELIWLVFPRCFWVDILGIDGLLILSVWGKNHGC